MEAQRARLGWVRLYQQPRLPRARLEPRRTARHPPESNRGTGRLPAVDLRQPQPRRAALGAACSVEGLRCFGEEPEIVGEDAEHGFASPSRVAASRQGRPEAALVLAEAALGMPALVVERAREALAHRAPVWGFRPAPSRVAAAEADHGPADAERVAAWAVVVPGVVARPRRPGRHPWRPAPPFAASPG